MKRFLLFLCLMALSCVARAEGERSPGVSPDRPPPPAPMFEEDEVKALKAWAREKRKHVTISDKGGNLTLSGEVRTEFQTVNETKNGVRQRQPRGAVPDKAMYNWDFEVNLLFNYRTDYTWATCKLEFDNPVGIGDGKFNAISLERALLGGRLLTGERYNVDIDIGRRALGYEFDSGVQFGSSMNGILVKYDHALQPVGDFYVHAGPFLIDSSVNHYGYVGEVGLLKIGGTGLYAKGSLIDRNTRKFASDRLRRLAYSFRNVQGTLGYKWYPEWLDGQVTTLYVAGLYNTAARRHEETGRHRDPWACYVGLSAGELRKQWDWSFNINYQLVQAQSVPDFDGSGVGRGNVAGTGLYGTKKRGAGDPLTVKTSVGSGNYHGYAIELQYNITNTVTVYQSWGQAFKYRKDLGPDFSYKRYEIELIYTF
ncbi:MAG: hypothetical protein OXF02_03655 [Simkaniaceae bacterium]|nr:hypothetical protein [Simkaniaceae bacterium]